MCVPAILGALGAAGAGGAATAAGAGALAGTTTAATGLASLQGLGTLVSMGGALFSGISQYRAAKQNVALIEEQKQTEAQINAIEDHRSRMKFMSAIRQQSAQLVASGVTLDSPTAVTLGQNAARELSYESQSVRAGGQARQTELSAEQRALRARGRTALFKGGLSAAGTLLDDAPDIWPELLR
ncbi:hypothetical protein [Oceaniglobus trochenteri]|uniref:hypothetical protein n=1 Tax=Oceaniglobus trochenteri TaxID=2763260 RepID=UPI001CFF98F3|nr:hypothetical protein [Oceaniglobus trochenteri]